MSTGKIVWKADRHSVIYAQAFLRRFWIRSRRWQNSTRSCDTIIWHFLVATTFVWIPCHPLLSHPLVSFLRFDFLDNDANNRIVGKISLRYFEWHSVSAVRALAYWEDWVWKITQGGAMSKGVTVGEYIEYDCNFTPLLYVRAFVKRILVHHWWLRSFVLSIATNPFSSVP